MGRSASVFRQISASTSSKTTGSSQLVCAHPGDRKRPRRLTGVVLTRHCVPVSLCRVVICPPGSSNLKDQSASLDIRQVITQVHRHEVGRVWLQVQIIYVLTIISANPWRLSVVLVTCSSSRVTTRVTANNNSSNSSTKLFRSKAKTFSSKTKTFNSNSTTNISNIRTF